MERIFWVKCPKCGDRFYVDYALRFQQVSLFCPFCECSFTPSESPEVDDRWY